MKRSSPIGARWCVAMPAITLAAACGLTSPQSPLSLSSLPAAPAPPARVELASLGDGAPAVAAAVVDREEPDPDPPAHRDAEGKPQGPGGPASDAPRDCGPEHNHCLRANGWFTDAFYEGEVAKPRVPVYRLDGHFYTWKRGKLAKGRVYRSKPATAATLMKAKEVYVFVEPSTGKATFKQSDVFGVLPKSEKDALTSGHWLYVQPYTVDAAAGTFVDNYAMTFRISATREAFDLREAD